MTHESKHTPGPWRISRGSSWTVHGPTTSTACGGWQTRTILSIDAGLTPMNADAALIAAAPTMLAALEYVATEYPCVGCVLGCVGCRARDAIAATK